MGLEAGKIIAQWFKPAAQSRAVDVYWDPWEECVKNSLEHMLEQLGTDSDNLYWEEEPPTPKQKWVNADEESINDSISTVKTAASKKKTPRSALKSSPATSKDNQEFMISDNAMVMLQQASISQLMEQITVMKVKKNKLLISSIN